MDKALLTHIVNQKMRSPEWVGILTDCLDKLNAGFFSQAYVDRIFQKWERFPTDLYDAYIFANVHTWLNTGAILSALIDVGEEPSSDSDVEGMNKKLGLLTHPFQAEFWGGPQDADGQLIVAHPIEFQQHLADGSSKTQLIGGVFPLEVGTIEPGKTMIYLGSHRGRLARWPYGSTQITLFARIEGNPQAPRMAWERRY